MSKSKPTTGANRRTTENPAARAARLRALLFDGVSDEDFRAVVTALVAKARAGDIAAIHELLSWLMPQPDGPDQHQHGRRPTRLPTDLELEMDLLSLQR